jgi:hypothetical protein
MMANLETQGMEDISGMPKSINKEKKEAGKLRR